MNRTTILLALRVFARRKVFTAISLVGISLTLVVLLVVAAIFDSALAPQQPQSKLDRILTVTRVRQHGPHSTQITNGGRGFFDRTLRDLPGSERMTIAGDTSDAVIYNGASRLEVPSRLVDAEYWRVFNFRFLEGGPFGDVDTSSNHSVVVISDELRHKLFGDDVALGKTIDIGGQNYKVVGVVPRPPVVQFLVHSDVWMPLGPAPAEERTALTGHYFGVVLLAPGADRAAAKAEFMRRVSRMKPSDEVAFKTVESRLFTSFEAFASNLTGDRLGDQATTLAVTVISVLALLFMSLPALNLITLNLSRILERASEVGVRKAFGAPRRALIGQFVTENVLLTIIGGLIALPGAALLLAGIEHFELVPGMHFVLNLRVFFTGLLLAAFFGVFSGAYPAWRMARLDAVNALRGGVA